MTTDSPLTVVVLNDYCHINGGASRIAIDEAVSLAEAGLNVIFFAPNGPVCTELQQAPLEVICLDQPELLEMGKNPALMLQGLWNRKAYKRMKELLKNLDPLNTVVHLHGYTKALTSSPVRAASEARFAIIHTLHDFFAACPNGAFFDYQKNAPCPLTGLSAACIKTHCDKRAYAHKVYRVARGFAQKGPGKLPSGIHHYISLSRFSENLLRPYLPDDAVCYPLENLIEVPKLPAVYAAGKEAVVAVGRLDIEKGIEVLLEASGQAGVKLTLVGDGPLREQAETYENVHVTGWVSRDEVVKYLNQSRCVVFPSLWYETYGLVVAEAAARGLPAIVSDISAASERIEPGVNGWHVRAGDVEHLAQCLELTKDDEMIRRMGQAAYVRYWSNPPTRENHTKGLLDIYAKVLRCVGVEQRHAA